MSYLLGLCGQAGSGKDTVADHLVRQHGFVKLSFADPMKRFCQDVFDFSEEQLWGSSSSRNRPDTRYPRAFNEYFDEATQTVVARRDCLTPRYALQRLGTEFGRDCYEPIWVEYALRMTRLLQEGGLQYSAQRGLYPAEDSCYLPEGVVIADVRFRNEIEAIQQAGGKVLRVRPPEQRALQEWQQHASETEQFALPDSTFDGVIINRKVAFEVLYQDVDAMMAKLTL